MAHQHPSRRKFLKAAATTTAVIGSRSLLYMDATSVREPREERSSANRMYWRGEHGDWRRAWSQSVCATFWLSAMSIRITWTEPRMIPRSVKGTADAYEDYRKVLDRKDIDVVSIVTCDHWHVKIAVEALQAGKHVFCQKPLTLTLEENQLIRNACKKYPELVFTGWNATARCQKLVPSRGEYGPERFAGQDSHGHLQHWWR